MTKDNGKTARHEQLRYEYLLRNLAYLNEREMAEFDYLRQKIAAKQAQRFDYYNEPLDRQEPAYFDGANHLASYDYYQEDYYAEPDYGDEPDEDYTAQGLPVYVEETPQRHRRQKKKVSPASSPLSTPAPRPKKKKRRLKIKTLFKGCCLLVLLTIIGMMLMFIKGIFDGKGGQDKQFQAAMRETFHGKETKDGTNILILGSDQRITQGSTDARTDTIMVVNVGNKAKKVKMVSFMRDTLVNIPGVSAEGYYDSKLNSAFNIGEQNNHQGAELMRQTLKQNFDINIKYYMMVDFQTFAEAIDTLFPNGVKMNARFATVDGKAVDSVEVPDDLNMKDGILPNQTIHVGQQRMDGRTLLNYARFRKDDEGDFGRTKRQQEVMAALLSQIKDPTKLFTGSAAVGKILSLTSTNVSYPFLLTNGLSAVANGKNSIEQVTIPDNGDWIDEYDQYGGQALAIDFEKYQKRLTKLGLR